MNFLQQNKISLEIRDSILLKPGYKLSHTDEEVKNLEFSEFLINFMGNLKTFGYRFTLDTLLYVASLSAEEQIDLYVAIDESFKKKLGVTGYQPMYPNFPKQVQESHKLGRFLVGFFRNTVGVSVVKDSERTDYEKYDDLKILNVVNYEEFETMLSNIVYSNKPYTSKYSEIVEQLLNEEDFFTTYSDTPVVKENMVFIMDLVKKDEDKFKELIRSWLKTPTDIIRLYNPLLVGKTVFPHFKRPMRKAILEVIDNHTEIDCNQTVVEMRKKEETFKRLNERIRPADYAEMFPHAFEAFSKLCSGEKVYSYMGDLEESLLNNDLDHAIDLLVKRPGIFTRKLVHVLRLSKSAKQFKEIVDKFAVSAKDTQMNVLLQLLTFVKYNFFSEYRYYTKKNNTSFHVIPKPEMSDTVKARMEKNMPYAAEVIEKMIVEKIAENPGEHFSEVMKDKKIFINDDMFDFAIPTNTREEAHGLRLIGCGSRVSIPEDVETYRFFTQWKNLEKSSGYSGHRIDLDLGLRGYDENFKDVFGVGWNSGYNSAGNLATFSGDITDAPNGAMEYIDVKIKELKKAKPNVRYLVPSVYSYCGQSFDIQPDAMFGWMERKDADGQKGNLYDPRLVKDLFNLTGDYTSVYPLVLDLKTNKVIWLNIPLTNRSISVADSALGKEAEVNNAIQLIAATHYLSYGEILKLQAMALGELVDTAEDADVVYNSVEDLNVEAILSEAF